MSSGGVGASGSGDPNQISARTLPRPNSTQSPPPVSTPANKSATRPPVGANAASNALTGADQSKLSNRTLALLIQLQNQATVDGSAIPVMRSAATAAPGSPVGPYGARTVAYRNDSSSNIRPQSSPAFRSHQEEIDAVTGRYDAQDSEKG
jgi:hypothetical protein